MKKLAVALFLVLGFYMMSPILKLGIALAQQEPQPETMPVEEPEQSEQQIEPTPEQQTDSMPEQNPEPTPEKPDAE